MANCYKCKLFQVDEDQGYIDTRKKWKGLNDITTQILFTKYPEYSVRKDEFMEIMVVPTSNPRFMREIKTQMLIPYLKCKSNKVYEGSYLKMSLDLFNFYHTFVSHLKHEENGIFDYERGLSLVKDPKEIEEYYALHSDVEVYKEELLTFFRKGELKMFGKMIEQKITNKQKEKEDSKNIQRLIRENK